MASVTFLLTWVRFSTSLLYPSNLQQTVASSPAQVLPLILMFLYLCNQASTAHCPCLGHCPLAAETHICVSDACHTISDSCYAYMMGTVYLLSLFDWIRGICLQVDWTSSICAMTPVNTSQGGAAMKRGPCPGTTATAVSLVLQPGTLWTVTDYLSLKLSLLLLLLHTVLPPPRCMSECCSKLLALWPGDVVQFVVVIISVSTE